MTTDLFDPPARPKRTIQEPRDDRPIVVYEKSLGHVGIDDALGPLAASGLVYSRSNRLVQVLFSRDAATDDDIDRESSSPVISEVSAAHLWELLSRVAAWMKYDGRAKKMVGCDPPGQVVSAISTRGHWDGISELRGISTVPILRRDGSVSTQPGYDQVSGLFYTPNGPEPVIQGSPGRDDAERAAEQLLDPVSQFPWVAPHHASAWLSTVLARVAKPAFDGSVPMCVIDSNTPGTGKSKLVDASSVISTGLLAARSPYVGDDEELRKRITAHLMAGDQICLIDNVPGGRTVGWPALDCALTAGVWSDRELGRSNRVRLPMDAQFFVTGNNIGIGSDAGRRTLRIRIQSPLPNPELRTGFKRDPIIPWLRQERPYLLGYALTVVRAYLLAGRPDVGLTSIGSFEGWSAVVRSSMVWAGLQDPALALANKEPGLDEEADAHVTLLRCWASLVPDANGGLTAANILTQVQNRNLEALNEAIQTICPTRDGALPTPRRFGHALRTISERTRTVGGHDMKVVRRHDNTNMASWAVVTCNEPKVTNTRHYEKTESDAQPSLSKKTDEVELKQADVYQGFQGSRGIKHQEAPVCQDKSRPIGLENPNIPGIPGAEEPPEGGCGDAGGDAEEPPEDGHGGGDEAGEEPPHDDTERPWWEDEDDEDA